MSKAKEASCKRLLNLTNIGSAGKLVERFLQIFDLMKFLSLLSFTEFSINGQCGENRQNGNSWTSFGREI